MMSKFKPIFTKSEIKVLKPNVAYYFNQILFILL